MTDRHGLQAKLQPRIVPFAAGSRKTGPRQGIAAPGQHPHHPRVAAAQPGRQTGARAGHPRPGVVAAEGGADRGDPVRGGARAPAGLHRRSAGGGSRGDAQRGRQGQEASQADRAPGAGRSGGRSLGPGGLRASAQCAPAQHAHRVHAQSGPIRVPQVGDERLRRAEDRPSRHRDRAPGQPRVPGSRRTRTRRRLLSRFTCRNRLPHHDDQRARHRGLGSGRHRSGSGHARAAHVFPHSRRGGRAPARDGAFGGDGNRRGPHGHRDAPQGQGGRQVRRVLWRRSVEPRSPRARDHRQHSARVWRHHGVLPGRRAELPVPARDRAAQGEGGRGARLFPGAADVRHPEEGPVRLHPGPRAGSRQREAQRRRPQAPAGSHRAAEAEGGVLQDPPGALTGRIRQGEGGGGKALPPDCRAPPARPARDRRW